MKTLILLLGWCVLFVFCWPLALLLLVLLPLLYLIALPFRLAAATVEAVLALIKTLLFLPARILGYRKRC